MEATWLTEPGLQETGTIQVWRQNGVHFYHQGLLALDYVCNTPADWTREIMSFARPVWRGRRDPLAARMFARTSGEYPAIISELLMPSFHKTVAYAP